MEHMRCFVAMALARRDTDLLYDRAVKPLLRREGITPVRIDRLEFNEDIDDRIISELKGCDFVIADLTYARPSVYFEAGYAQRAVPVIYTCREDHLHPRLGDEFGNFRVHFDLQMKNIISWADPCNEVFLRRLGARVRKVVVPLLRAQKQHQERAVAARAFQGLPLLDRRRRVADIVASVLRGASFVVSKAEEHWVDWVAFRRTGNNLLAVAAVVMPRFSKETLSQLMGLRRLCWIPEFRKCGQKLLRGVEHVAEIIFVCSIERVTPSTRTGAMPAYGFDHELKAYVRDQITHIEIGVDIPSRAFIHVVDAIMSEDDARSEVGERIRSTLSVLQANVPHGV